MRIEPHLLEPGRLVRLLFLENSISDRVICGLMLMLYLHPQFLPWCLVMQQHLIYLI